MSEERRCDLCQDEKDLPCVGKDCNSGTNLKGFRPKGSEPEQQDGLEDLLNMRLNSVLTFAYGRYICVPDGWVFESDEGGVCFIPNNHL